MKIARVLVAGSLSVLLLSSAATAQIGQAEANLLVPDPIKPSGAHGTVVLEGDIGPDGHMANLRVTKSSQSEEIDQFALNRYAHALVGDDLKGGSGRIALTVRVYNTQGMDFGARYSCQQAVLDNDWYKKTFATADNEHNQLYLLIEAGGNIMGRPELAFAKDHARYDRVWSDAVEACRKTPDATWFATILRVGRDVK